MPVIAQSAFSLDKDKDESLNCGCNDYLVKPIQREAFLKKITSILSKNVEMVKKRASNRMSLASNSNPPRSPPLRR